MNKAEAYREIEEHYREHYAKLVSRYTRYAGGYHNAQDVVQEAYTRACRYWDSLDKNKTFKGWFSTILVNCLKDSMKETRAHGMAEDPVQHDVAPRAVHRLMIKDVVRLVEKEKNPDTQLALHLYFFEQWKTTDISQVVSHSHANVRTLVHTFRKRLRKAFDQRIFE